MYKLLLHWDFPKENFSCWIFFLLRLKQKSFQILSIDYFHNISVNTQYERILINAVHMAIFYSWTFSLENESISVKITSLIVGVFEKISVEYTIPHFLPFQFTVLISSDLQWLAKISDQKKKFVEGEWWTVGGVWPHGYCTCLLMSSSLGSSPGWGHCAVFWDTTLISLYPGV